MNKLKHEIPLHNRFSKDSHFIAQKKAIYKAFKEPSTMLMVSIETGILRANICRYVAELKKQGKIRLIRKDLCKISNRKAGYLTTNENIGKCL